jgi:tetratricopeptide (TPR) repeat protein
MLRLAAALVCLLISLAPAISAQTPRVAELPEFAGPPIRRQTSINATPALRRFVDSKLIHSADPKNPATLAPAIQELTELITMEPTNSDFRLLRATLFCSAHASSKAILDDITASVSLHRPSSSASATLKDHYALKAKVELEAGQYQDSMRDMDAALKQDYGDAEDVFNDGETKASTTKQPCKWTLADFDLLETQFPHDYRPHLYRGLYLMIFHRFDLKSDYKDVLAAFERAAALDAKSPLPHYFTGELHIVGSLGGMLSVKNAECLDWVVPRTPACLALDETHREGIRSLTRAIALDPKFRPAYALRANGLLKLKEYRQAIRDYDKVLELTPVGENASGYYNDRGLAKTSLGQHEAAVLDFTQSISLNGGKVDSYAYDNRAEAYVKLHNYAKAVDDITASIKRHLSNAVFLMNIDQFRQIYPEYDTVPDEVLCEKLRALFFPQMQYADFSRQFLIEAKEYHSTVLPDLYVKRGDAYAAMKQFTKANIEYDRVSRAFPNWASVSFVEQNGKRVRNRQ